MLKQVFVATLMGILLGALPVSAGIYEKCLRKPNGLPKDPDLTEKQEEMFCRCLDMSAKGGKISYKKIEIMLDDQNEDLRNGTKTGLNKKLKAAGVVKADFDTFQALATYCGVKSLTGT